ncbi:MAG: hypothetical protein U9R77_14060 [Pseudomonadota bacterium]|nr:hypothetical protein [Pseudomonadota bacterium]
MVNKTSTARPARRSAAAPAPTANAATQPGAAVAGQVDSAEGPTRWLEMKVGISGTQYSLSPGWKHPFCDQPGPNGEPSEAQRLIDAGFALETDPPADA